MTPARTGPAALPRLRTIVVGVGLIILGLPLAALTLLRVYDTQLVRHTESELVAQGAVVAAAFREAVQQRGAGEGYGVPVSPAHVADDPMAVAARPALNLLRDRILPPPEDGVAGATADPLAADAGAAVTPLLAATSAVTLAGIRVVDAHGVVVATTRSELGLSLAAREEVRRALAGEHVSLVRQRVSDSPMEPLNSLSRNSRVRVFVGLPVVEKGRVLGAVILSRTPMSLGKAYYEDRYELLVMAIVLLGVVLAVSLVTTAAIVRPIHAIVRQAEAIAAGKREAAGPLPRPGTREVAQLSEAVTRMAATLHDRADYIRGFAAAVSHEFKTPLASISGTVELLRDHLADMSAEQRDRFLANLASDTARLEQLVRRLLELARADVLTPAGETCEAGAVLERVRERYDAAGKPIAVTAALDTRVAIAGEALETIVSNLVDNAWQHGGDGVTVQVDAVATPDGRHVEVRVRDDGAGISAANADRVWEPFFTTARARGGTGLGLTIVRSLARAHGGTVELEPTGRGTCACVRLPRAG